VDLGESEEKCVKALRRACQTTGFFFLAGHGVGEELVDSVFAGGKRFFTTLNQKQKDEFKAKEGEHPFDYQSAVIENIKLDPVGQKLPDQREQLKFGRRNYLTDYNSFMSSVQAGNQEKRTKRREGSSDDDDKRVVWLSEESTEQRWRVHVNEYFEAVSSLGHRLLGLLALSLGLEGAHFDEFFNRALELMNINFYHDVQSDLGAGKLGCGSHTDYGMITLLMTDHVPGLQVCANKSAAGEREWIDVEPRRNQFVVNVGDMLERWTNGEYLSNVHRVFNSGRERVSIAFFFEPNVDALISPITPQQHQGGQEEFSEVVYGQWLADKYKKTGEVI
jgi:isopenicillin N synthase-like dioxygenase